MVTHMDTGDTMVYLVLCNDKYYALEVEMGELFLSKSEYIITYNPESNLDMEIEILECNM